MKKILFLILFIASGLFAQFNDGDGYFQKYQWNLLSNNVLESIYALQIGQNGGTSGSITFVASDNDQFTFVINTSDQAVFDDATGGYKFGVSAVTYTLDDNYIHSGTGAKFGITPGNASATNATFRPMRDNNSGAGSAHLDQPTIVAGGVEAQRTTEGDGEVSTILSGTVVETITDATSAGGATLTKAGENFDVTCSVGDAVLVYGGTTAGDYGTYIITVVTSATVLTLDRALAGSDADVDFDVVADGVIIENSTNTGVATLRVPQFTQYLTIVSGQATVGSTAPTVTTVGTYRGLSFDADAELVFFEFEVPDDWNGVSDMTLKAYWTNEAGDALADGETVKFDFDYRSRAEGEALDGGSAVSVSGTYTQSGAGTDKELIEGQVTLDYDHADQPLTKGDLIGIKANRDMTTDSYAGDITIFKWEIAYTAYTFSLHN